MLAQHGTVISLFYRLGRSFRKVNEIGDYHHVVAEL